MKLNHYVFARRALVIVAAPVCAAFGGCMSTSPIWDEHFGESVRTIMQAQIIDPEAGEHNPSIPGIDGKAADSAMTRYEKSFEAPPPTFNPFMMSIGGGGGGGGGQ